MSDINYLKTQAQILIDLVNATTGNNDTNLTDGVNALVSGYGQGGDLPTDTLVGLENGYDVMFYDENNEGLAFYSIKQGHSIEAPIYDCKNWQTSNGANVVFPYTPSGDAIFYANNDTYASALYKYYGVDSAIYPYVCIFAGLPTTALSKTFIYFAKSLSANETAMGFVNALYGDGKYVNRTTFDMENDFETLVARVMENVPPDSLQSGSPLGKSGDYYAYTNYENKYVSNYIACYRLDQ